MTLDEFFASYPQSRRLFDALSEAVFALGPAELAVTKSQVAFRAKRPFAWVWVPERYLGRGAPLVLSLSLRRRDASGRWKQVVEPAPGRFTHHLELFEPHDINHEVVEWLAEARRAATSAGTNSGPGHAAGPQTEN